MPIGSILLIAALSAIVLFYLALPFVTGKGLGKQENQNVSALLAERERILGAILELEADNQLGKVPKAVFREQRQSLLEKGALILAELEQTPAGPASEAALEKIIADHRKQTQ